MSTIKTVDPITIGAGGGAYPAAFRLAKAGHQVVMVDTKGVMSGNCLSEGCVPSKAVREMALHLHRHQRFQKFRFLSRICGRTRVLEVVQGCDRGP
ncbi:MAG: FAD-dependent oxidoreductase, partial [Acidobacteriaceae bacterium]